MENIAISEKIAKLKQLKTDKEELILILVELSEQQRKIDSLIQGLSFYPSN